MANRITRRELLGAAAGAATAAPARSSVRPPRRRDEPGPALCLNEDDSHYFATRAGQKLDAERVASWVDQYADTQVRELMICPNSMRTGFASRAWDPIWRGYDPEGPDDQPLLASTNPADRRGARDWIHTAWQLAHDGIDPYALWMTRARSRNLSPWISTRMNDIHNVDDEKSYIHSEFWRNNPQFRRVPYRFTSWPDRALDFGHAEVRAHHMALITELSDRYDFDGLELDWMRFGYHFRPGHEAEGAEILTQFTADVRRLLNRWEKRRGHRIRLGARVPSRPATSLGLGMDAATWARRGLVDMLVITPFWATAEPDMPIELWKEILHGTHVTLAAGLELLLRPYPEFPGHPTNSLETVRGAAASLLDRGVDRIYLFNYMDSQTAMADLEDYPTVLRECGSPATLAGKSRRHVVTYSDTYAPGEPGGALLPTACSPGQWRAFRLPIGPKPTMGRVEARVGIEGVAVEDLRGWEVRLNGVPCSLIGPVSLEKPSVNLPAFAFDVPLAAVNRGNNLVEIAARKAGRIVWVELAVLC